MQINDKKKICVVVSSLADGGAERSSALLTQMLHKLGHNVHVVTVLPRIDYKYAGTLLNLGELKQKNDSLFGRFNRLKVFNNYLKEHKFDFIIDNRTRSARLRETILSKFIYYRYRTIYCVRSFNLDKYIINPQWLSRWLYADAYEIVANSKIIEKELIEKLNFTNVSTIYNAVEIEEIKFPSKSENYILYFGRIKDEVKNISLLINAYHKSNLPQLNIKLKVLGDGVDIDKMKRLSNDLNLNDKIEFLGYNPKPNGFIKDAKFCVLTSRFEGFPRVLLESLALGTPVISVDCKSGPSEIINHRENGLLVENYNEKALADAMNEFILNKELYLRCKENAQKSVEQYSLYNIAKDWQKLLEKNG